MTFFTPTRRYAVATVAALAITACGGGGSDSPAPSTSATTTFPLAAAMINLLKEARSVPFSITGTASRNGQPLEFTGSGTSIESNTAGTFNGAIALVKNTTVTGSLGAQGTNVPFTDVSIQYFDSNYKPLGSSALAGYCVFSAQIALPATARVGDTGAYYAATCYTTSAKTRSLGTSTATYVLVPATETTAIFKLTSKFTTTAGVTTSQTSNYVVSTNGSLTLSDTPLSGITLSGVTVDLVMKYQ